MIAKVRAQVLSSGKRCGGTVLGVRDCWACLLCLHLLGHLLGWWRPGLGRESTLTQTSFAYDLHLHANHRQLRTHWGHKHTQHPTMYAHTHLFTNTYLHTWKHTHTHIPCIHTSVCTHTSWHTQYTHISLSIHSSIPKYPPSPPSTHCCTYNHTDTHAPTCMYAMHVPLYAHTPMHTCTLHIHSQLELWYLWKNGPLGLMLGLCPSFLEILWGLANRPRSSGCLPSPQFLSLQPGQDFRTDILDLCLLPNFPTAGADHHHVRVGQPQRLCGAWLPLCPQAAHHPLPATEECGEPPGAHQPFWQCCCQGQLQPWPRSASYATLSTQVLRHGGPAPG